MQFCFNIKGGFSYFGTDKDGSTWKKEDWASNLHSSGILCSIKKVLHKIL
jgi:hypothetical protein